MSNCGPLAGVPVAAKIQIQIFCRILTRVGYSTTILTAAGLVIITHFYPVDCSQSRIGIEKCISTNAKSRFASAVVDDVLGPSPPSAAHLTLSLFLCRSTHEASSGPLKSAVSAHKAFQGSERETREEQKRKMFPR